jgi:hypothetical protein
MAAVFLAVWPLPFLAAVPLQAAVPLNNYSGRAAASGRAAEKLAVVPLEATTPLKNSCKRMNKLDVLPCAFAREKIGCAPLRLRTRTIWIGKRENVRNGC